MKPIWKVRRTGVAHDDGQRRWDYAYHFLLQWATDSSADRCSASTQQEEDNECSSLRPGLDPSATAGSDD